MSELAEWLLTQVGADEEVVPSMDCACRDGEPQRPDCADRVLNEVAMKRSLIEMAAQWIGPVDPGIDGDDVLRLLAAPYASRDGYRQEWAPE